MQGYPVFMVPTPTQRVGSAIPHVVSHWSCGTPLSHEDGDICSGVPMPASSGQVDSLWARTSNVGICAPKQSNVLDARLMEMQFGREPLGAN
jgi:hypothetical protein